MEVNIFSIFALGVQFSVLGFFREEFQKHIRLIDNNLDHFLWDLFVQTLRMVLEEVTQDLPGFNICHTFVCQRKLHFDVSNLLAFMSVVTKLSLNSAIGTIKKSRGRWWGTIFIAGQQKADWGGGMRGASFYTRSNTVTLFIEFIICVHS